LKFIDAYVRLRRVLLRQAYKGRFGAFGPGSSFDPSTSSIAGIENFYIGADVYIGPHAILSADDVPVVIGDGTIIGPGFCVMAGDHDFRTAGVSYGASPRGRNEPVVIGRNVWIGARVLLLKGVNIGDGSVIGAGAVVSRDVPPFSIALGVPARVIRSRFEGSERATHEAFIERELRMPSVPVRP
jgi:acetyltransferase-like isoleucine patch superfamily enzyme